MKTVDKVTLIFITLPHKEKWNTLFKIVSQFYLPLNNTIRILTAYNIYNFSEFFVLFLN